MSKGGPIIALGVAAPCTVVGAFYLAKSTNIDATLPQSLDEFKKKDGGYCVQTLFPGMKEMKSDSAKNVDSSTNKVDSNLLGSGSETPEGCLVINGDKENHSSDKFKGNFRFLWAMKKGKQGFITFNKASVPKEDGEKDKIKGEGIAYTMKQDGLVWSIDKKKEVTPKEVDNSEAKTKFPTKGESISDLTEGDAFGFMNTSSDTEKICGKSVCDGSAESKSHFQGYGKGTSESGDSGKAADKWSKNLDTWGNDLYSKNSWDMQGVVSKVKGSGTKVLTSSNPTTTQATGK